MLLQLKVVHMLCAACLLISVLFVTSEKILSRQRRFLDNMPKFVDMARLMTVVGELTEKGISIDQILPLAGKFQKLGTKEMSRIFDNCIKDKEILSALNVIYDPDVLADIIVKEKLQNNFISAMTGEGDICKIFKTAEIQNIIKRFPNLKKLADCVLVGKSSGPGPIFCNAKCVLDGDSGKKSQCPVRPTRAPTTTPPLPLKFFAATVVEKLKEKEYEDAVCERIKFLNQHYNSDGNVNRTQLVVLEKYCATSLMDKMNETLSLMKEVPAP